MRPRYLQLSLLWFIAGFITCLAVSVVGVLILMWLTPPAPEEPTEEGHSQAPQGSQPYIELARRRLSSRR